MGIYRTVYEEPGTGRMWGLSLWEPPAQKPPLSQEAPASRGRKSAGRFSATPAEQPHPPTLPAGWYLVEGDVGGDEVRVLDGFRLTPDTPIEIAGREAEAYARRRGFRPTRVPTPFQWPPEEWRPK